MLQNKDILFRHLGLIDYQEAWEYQEHLFAQVIATKTQNRQLPPEKQQPTANHLLFCSHPHVYTLGKSGAASNLLINEETLAARQASFYKINRGGDITYHGPGQLVGYPILDLDNFLPDIHQYLRLLEETVILTLADYGVVAGRIKGLTGVWIGHEAQVRPRKICALGVKCSRWVTMHGFAFNLDPDLSYFGHIVPCGITDKEVTSLARELGTSVAPDDVEEKLLGHFSRLFGANIKAGAHEGRYQL